MQLSLVIKYTMLEIKYSIEYARCCWNYYDHYSPRHVRRTHIRTKIINEQLTFLKTTTVVWRGQLESSVVQLHPFATLHTALTKKLSTFNLEYLAEKYPGTRLRRIMHIINRLGAPIIRPRSIICDTCVSADITVLINSPYRNHTA